MLKRNFHAMSIFTNSSTKKIQTWVLSKIKCSVGSMHEWLRKRGRRYLSDSNEKHFLQYQFHVSRITSIPILAIYDYYLFCQQNSILLLLLSFHTYIHTYMYMSNIHTNIAQVSLQNSTALLFSCLFLILPSYLWGIKWSMGNKKIPSYNVTGMKIFNFVLWTTINL